MIILCPSGLDTCFVWFGDAIAQDVQEKNSRGEAEIIYAEDNGFNDDDTVIDDNPVPRDVLDCTKERYNAQMGRWME